MTFCTGVAQWYRVGGRDTPEKIGERYVALARAMAQAGPQDGV